MKPFASLAGTGSAGVIGATLSALVYSLVGLAWPGAGPISESDAITRVYYQALPGVVQVVDRGRLSDGLTVATVGSGFVVDLDGHLLTNEHVVHTVHDPGVVFSDGSVLPADVVGSDPGHDLAVLRVEVPRERLHPLALGDSSRLEVGRRVAAIGSPYGLARSLSSGVVSYVGRPMAFRDGVPPMETIQTDAAINPGNSGGPLLDLSGQVVGVSVGGCLKAVWSFDGGSVGVGFAVPANDARRLLPEMIGGSLAAKPWLGATVADAAPPTARDPNSGQRGARIVAVQTGGPAERAGLRGVRYSAAPSTDPPSEGDGEAATARPEPGDLVVGIDGRKVESAGDLRAYLTGSGRRVGDAVTLQVERGGETLEVAVRLSARDETQVGAI